MRRFIWLINSLVITVAMSAAVYASGTTETYGASAQGISMGNAMTSIVHDWSSVFYNTAGLGRSTYKSSTSPAEEGRKTMALTKKSGKTSGAIDDKIYKNEVYLGVMYTHPMFEMDINRFDEDGNSLKTPATEDLNYGALQVGMVFDFNLLFQLPEQLISSCRLGLGMVTNWDLSVVTLNDVDLKTHDFLRYGREASRLSLNLALGFGLLNDLIGFGIGVNASFAGTGAVQLDEVQVSTAEQTPLGEAKMDLALKARALAGMYFDFGRIVGVLEGLSIGASYRQEQYLYIDPFDTVAIIQNGTLYMTLLLSLFDYYTPHIVTTGISYSRWGATIAFDMDYEMWSDFKVSSKKEYYYTKTQNDVGMPKMQDILIYKVGLSYDVFNWFKIMAGYIYEPSFVTNSAVNGIYNFMDNDKHIASIGTTFTVGKYFGMQGPVEITIGYQFQYLMPRDIVKDGTKIADYYNGYLGMPYADYRGYNPNYSYGGMCHTVILGLGFKL